MRVAQLGAGRIGRLHAGLLAELAGADSVVLFDPATDLARQVAADTGVRCAATLDEAITDADAMVITASSSAHAELIRAGLGRLPIFCEKPLAPELAEARELAEEIEAAGTPFQLGFQRRFDAAYRSARHLVESGDLGRVYCIRLAGHDPEPPHESYIPASGGLFQDFSVHDFDITRWLTGQEIGEVYADGGVLGFDVFAKYGDIDTAVATLRLSGGTLGVLTVARHDPLGYDIRTELFGSRDSVTIGLGPRTPMRSLEPGVPPPAGPAWSAFLERFTDAYRDELAAFLRLARGGGTSGCTARDGLEAQRAAVAAQRSLAEHRPVTLTEVE